MIMMTTKMNVGSLTGHTDETPEMKRRTRKRGATRSATESARETEIGTGSPGHDGIDTRRKMSRSASNIRTTIVTAYPSALIATESESESARESLSA